MPANAYRMSHLHLRNDGHLASVDKDQLTVSRTIAGKRRRVLHIRTELLTGEAEAD